MVEKLKENLKKLTVACEQDGKEVMTDVLIGQPNPEYHPLHFQRWWLAHKRHIILPDKMVDSFDKLGKIASENDVNFCDLTAYALSSAGSAKDVDVYELDHFRSKDITHGVPTKKDGNVLEVNFQAAAMNRDKAKKEAPEFQSKLLEFAEINPHQAFHIVASFCHRFIPDKELQAPAAQNLLFGLIFYRSMLEEGSQLLQELINYAHMPFDDFLYNLAVILDCVGDRIHFTAFDILARSLLKAEHTHGEEMLGYQLYLIYRGLENYRDTPHHEDFSSPFEPGEILFEISKWKQ